MIKLLATYGIRAAPVVSSALPSQFPQPVHQQTRQNMLERHHVEGYENFLKFMEDFKADGPVFVLYTGTKLPNGKSWCPDCVVAEPHIEEGLKSAPENSRFVVAAVGDRAFWKDRNCPFRTNPNTKLNVLPTLARWGTQKRLQGDECSNSELMEMLLADD